MFGDRGVLWKVTSCLYQTKQWPNEFYYVTLLSIFKNIALMLGELF